MNDDWYTDKGGITRRRRGTWEGFWGIFMVANLFAIAVFIGVLIWAFFDVEHRIGYAMVAQIPPIAMMVIRRVFRD